MGHRGNTGICFGAGVSAPSESATKEQGPFTGCPGVSGSGDPKAIAESGHPGGGPMPGPVPELRVHSAQEGWVREAGSEPEALEQVPHQEEVQDGRGRHDQGSAQGGRLDDLNRSQGCLPDHPYPRSSQEVPPLPMEGEAFPVSVPSLRVEQCPQSIHKGTEACHGSTEETGNQMHCIHRRHTPIAVGVNPQRDHNGGPQFAEAVRFFDQLGEILSHSKPGDPLPRLPDQFRQHDPGATSRQAAENPAGLQAYAENGIDDPPSPSTSDRQNDGHYSSYPPSSPVLQESPKSQEHCVSEIPVVRYNADPDRRGQAGTDVVVGGSSRVEWSSCVSGGTTHDHRDRCIPSGMGCPDRGQGHRGHVVSPGTEDAHKSSGADGGHLRHENICEERHGFPHQAEDGQPDGSVLHQPPGRDQILNPGTPYKGALGVVPPERDHSVSRVSPGIPECDSRQRVQNSSINRGMDAGPSDVPGLGQQPGTIESRHVRDPAEQPNHPLLQLETGPICTGNRCTANTLDRTTGRLCVPTLLTDREMPPEGEERRIDNRSTSPSMADPVLVSYLIGEPSGSPSPPAVLPNPAEGPLRGTEPTAVALTTPPISRLESIGRRYQAEGFSPEATNLITAGWSTGTNTVYQSAWRKWCSWCSGEHIDPLSGGVNALANYLAKLFSDGLQHRSINTARSAISMTHSHVEGLPLGKHQAVSRIMRGIYNSRPPTPKYTVTWDVRAVTSFLKGLGPNGTLSLKQLSGKLVMLMALVEASRSSELAALDLRFRSFNPEGVSFKLPTLTKKRSPGAPPRELLFGAFPDDTDLCVCQCLRAYEEATIDLRTQPPSAPNRLFISHVKPHRPVTSQRIAHWLRDVMEASGVDTRVFSAHSTRGAATSAARDKGVPLQDILQTADWSRESTFTKFYYRPSQAHPEAAFAMKVLSSP